MIALLLSAALAAEVGPSCNRADQYRCIWHVDARAAEGFAQLGFNLAYNPTWFWKPEAKGLKPNAECNLLYWLGLGEKYGFDVGEGLGVLGYHQYFRKKYPQVRDDGSNNGYPDMSSPECRAECRAQMELGAALVPKDNPRFAGISPTSEVRDKSMANASAHFKEAWRRYSGSKKMPSNNNSLIGPHYRSIRGFPASRVIDENWNDFRFYQWCWKEGDGWNLYDSDAVEVYNRVVGRPLFTFYDPAVRCPPIWGSGGTVSHLNQWTYVYPDPFNISFVTASTEAMARGRGQGVCEMIQGISYRSQLAPMDVVPPGGNPEWVERQPKAVYISTPPDMAQEALWTLFSHKLDGIMFHGWQSILDADPLGAEHHGYQYTNADLKHTISNHFNGVGRELGPLFKALPESGRRVAYLESSPAWLFAKRGGWGYGGSPYSAPGEMATLANLMPYVLYDEEIARDGIPAETEILMMPSCDVLMKKTCEAVKAFQARGGVVIGDEVLSPAILPDEMVPAFTRKHQAEADVPALRRAAGELKAIAKKYMTLDADSDRDDIFVRLRRLPGADYLFAINDRREKGDYVGQWGLVWEKGCPNRGRVSVKRRAGAVYDLARHTAVPFEVRGDTTFIDVDYATNDGRVYLVADRPLAPLAWKNENGRITVTSADRDLYLPIEVSVDTAKPFYGVIRDGVWSHDFGRAESVSIRNLANGEVYEKLTRGFGLPEEPFGFRRRYEQAKFEPVKGAKAAGGRPLFAPRIVHSGWGFDEFSDAYLDRMAEAGFDAITFYVDSEAEPRATELRDLIHRAKARGLGSYLYSRVNKRAFIHPDDPGAEKLFDEVYGALAAAFMEAKGILFVGESFEFPSKDERSCGLAIDYAKETRKPGDTRPYTGWFPCRDYPKLIEKVKQALHKVNPALEVVLWSYNWGYCEEGPRRELIANLPKDVTLLVTYEMFEKYRLRNGLDTKVADYSIAFEGPGRYFVSEAEEAKARGLRLYAMANTAVRTWDLGTIPYYPVPYQWKRRWDGMKAAKAKWGLSGVVDGHHFGWAPNFVSELCREAFTEGGLDFDTHIRLIAERDFGPEHAAKALAVWKSWSDAVRDTCPSEVNQNGPFRYGPSYPFNALRRDMTAKDFPIAPMFIDPNYRAFGDCPENSAANLEKELELLDSVIRSFFDGAEVFYGIGNRKAIDMGRLGEYIARCYVTAANVKRGLLAERAKDEAKVKELAFAEYENTRKALELVTLDSSLGYEPRMGYRADPKHLRMKLLFLEREYFGAAKDPEPIAFDFTGGEVPKGGRLRPNAELVAGGLAVKQYGNGKLHSGVSLGKRELPAAFQLEAVFSPLAVKSRTEGYLWDDLYVNYKHHRGLMVGFDVSTNGEWAAWAYFGFTNTTCGARGPRVKLTPGEEVRFSLRYDGEGAVSWTFAGETAASRLEGRGRVAPSDLPLTVGDRYSETCQPFNGIIHSVKLEPLDETEVEMRVKGPTAFRRGDSAAKASVEIVNRASRDFEPCVAIVKQFDEKGALVATRELPAPEVKRGETGFLEVPVDTSVSGGQMLEISLGQFEYGTVLTRSLAVKTVD